MTLAASVISERVHCVRAAIAEACANAGRNPTDVSLLAVSKTQSVTAIAAAFAAGQRAFGENYVQEALAKIEALAAWRGQLQWHFIGPLQANKTRAVAEHFDWVHTVDRLRIAERLSAQRPPGHAPLQLCIQVNTSGEASKSGVLPEEALDLARAVGALPRVTLRGLMAIPQPAVGFEAQCVIHRRLREVFTHLQREGLPLDTLSMGMSADMAAAIAEGATWVRVGTALFGEREGNAG